MMFSSHHKIKLAVSSCLAGEPVRYDGTAKQHPYVTHVLQAHFDLIPICPEVGIGLGVPRPTLQISESTAGRQAVSVADPSLNVTSDLIHYAEHIVQQHPDLCGYIFKARSPSCGVDSTPIFDEHDHVIGHGKGIFAQTIHDRRPALPLIEESGLDDPARRDRFLEQVFAYAHWQSLPATADGLAQIQQLMAYYQLTLMTHDLDGFSRIEQLLQGTAHEAHFTEVLLAEFMRTLGKPLDRNLHSHTLQLCLDSLQQGLPAADAALIQQAIDAYSEQEEPLVVPLTLLRHAVEKLPPTPFQQLHYLFPHPLEWQLRFESELDLGD